MAVTFEKPEWALRAESMDRLAPRPGWPPRTTWPTGPWDTEPDIVEWRAPESEYPCLIVRGPSGSLCGYVGLPEGHPWHGQAHSAVDEAVNVHGGLSYANECSGNICHVARPGEAEHVWWLGFDCAHAYDRSPAFENYFAQRGIPRVEGYDTYRDLYYVRGETESLARQAFAARNSDRKGAEPHAGD